MRTKEEITNLVKDNLLEIIPELEGEDISPGDSFTEIGANSVDRGELVTLTLERLNLEVSRIDFATAQTIDQLVDLILKKINV